METITCLDLKRIEGKNKIALNNIKRVSKTYRKLWNKNGSFKKFVPVIKVQTNNGLYLDLWDKSEFELLKKTLIKNYGMKAYKSYDYEYKNGSEKRIVEWEIDKPY